MCAAAGLPTGTVLYHGAGPVEDRWRLGAPPLLTGCEVSTTPASAHPHRPPLVLSVISGPDAGRWVAIGARPLTIGRHRDADLSLTDPAVSRWHALISPHPAGLIVADTGSVNGVHVHGEAVGSSAGDGPAGAPAHRRGAAGAGSKPGSSAVATTGSVIRVGGTLLQVQLTTEPPGGFRADGLGHLVRSGRPTRFQERMPALPARPVAPEPPVRRSLPLVTALIGAAVGGALALMLHNAMFLAFAALGPVMTIGSALGDRMAGRRSYRRRRADHRVAVEAWQAAVSARARAELLARWRRWPGPDVLARRAAVAGARLWERSHADTDYLHAAVGHGATLLDIAGDPPPHDTAPPAGDSTGLHGRLTVRDVPVVLPLTEVPGGVIGFVGPIERAVARYVLAQLACHHSPADLALAAIRAEPDLESFGDLPHAAEAAPTDRRDLVAVLDGPRACASPAGAALLTAAAGSAADGRARGRPHRVIALALADSPGDLPIAATPLTAALARTRDLLTPLSDHTAAGPPAPSSAEPFSLGATGYTQVGPALFREICQALAPLRDSPADAAGVDAPARGAAEPTVTLAHLGSAVPALTAAGVRERWSRPSACAALGMTVAASDTSPTGPAFVAPVPVDTAPQTVTALDLDADGPHLLIAGTTGSGKSELLQTLITAWVLAAPPTAVTFLLVDYKGGAAFGSIRALPHVVGLLTDLDPATSARALTSLRAELRRREQDQNAGSAPPPKLVLVIDEFATLAAELPEFLAGVLDIAQRGRSLGVHLVLATQRPAGVVSPAMRANISARICLRVTDPADSLDVLGVPDAAGIPAGRPGRAILRTGRGITMFQTARVTVPVPPDIVISGGPAGTVASRPDSMAPGLGVGPDADIVAMAVGAAVDAAGGLPSPRRPWLEPLPARIASSPRAPEMLARADLPSEQSQADLTAPDASVLIVGPPGSGRSTALRRIAEIAIHRGEELLVVDGAGALQDLETRQEVSSCLTVREPALVLRLLSLLGDPERRPPDGRRRHLLIDQYDVVAAELERADYLLGSSLLSELAARTHGDVRISATGPERLAQQRVASSFTEVITLGGATPPRGYTPPDAAGSTGAVPGRGRWRGAEVQLVDAPCQPGPSSAARWVDALVVRPLPAHVPFSALAGGGPDRLMIGLGGDAAEPCSVDLTLDGGGIVVAGPRRSGVTTALALLAARAATAGIPVLRVLTRYCHPSPAPDHAPAGIANDSLTAAPAGGSGDDTANGSPTGATTGPAAGPAAVIDIPCQEDPEPLRAALAAHEGPVLVIADHHGLGDEHPAAAVLERFLAVCGPGQHLAIGARLEVLARARRGHLRTAVAARRGLLLAPDKADGALFDIPLPQRRGIVPPGRGVLIWDGTPVPVQVSHPPRAAPAAPGGQRPVIPAAPTITAPTRPTPRLPGSRAPESIPVAACEQGHRPTC